MDTTGTFTERADRRAHPERASIARANRPESDLSFLERAEVERQVPRDLDMFQRANWIEHQLQRRSELRRAAPIGLNGLQTRRWVNNRMAEPEAVAVPVSTDSCSHGHDERCTCWRCKKDPHCCVNARRRASHVPARPS
jgi:hypothetical protein